MSTRRQTGRKGAALVLAGLLTMGSWGCVSWDNPGYVYISGVATGVMQGLVSLSVEAIGNAIGVVFFPEEDNSN